MSTFTTSPSHISNYTVVVKVDLCINVASYGNLWDIKYMSTFTTSPSHISNYTVVSLRENYGNVILLIQHFSED